MKRESEEADEKKRKEKGGWRCWWSIYVSDLFYIRLLQYRTHYSDKVVRHSSSFLHDSSVFTSLIHMCIHMYVLRTHQPIWIHFWGHHAIPRDHPSRSLRSILFNDDLVGTRCLGCITSSLHNIILLCFFSALPHSARNWKIDSWNVH